MRFRVERGPVCTIHSSSQDYYLQVTAPAQAGQCTVRVTPYLPTDGTGAPLVPGPARDYVFVVFP